VNCRWLAGAATVVGTLLMVASVALLALWVASRYADSCRESGGTVHVLDIGKTAVPTCEYPEP